MRFIPVRSVLGNNNQWTNDAMTKECSMTNDQVQMTGREQICPALCSLKLGHSLVTGHRSLVMLPRCYCRQTLRNAGFTLAEVLAALMFMAIVIPVAVQCLKIDN